MQNLLKFEYKIVGVYLLLGGLWILFSDQLVLQIVNDVSVVTKLQTVKGWFYVLFTSVALLIFLRRHLKKLRRAEKQAKTSDNLKTVFLQNISHEIRTPMNGIIGFSELLKNHNLAESQKAKYIEVIDKSSKRLLSVVENMLDFSLLVTGNVEIREQALHLNSFLRQLKKEFEPYINENIQFQLNNHLTDNDCSIISDETRLKQILSNLLTNAIKFTDKGTITLGYIIEEKSLIIYVSDTGIGINDNDLSIIFNSFIKSNNNHSPFHEGIGLGLSICKVNTELLGGTIKVHSQIKEGSTFTIILPLKKAKFNSEIINKTNHKELTKINTLFTSNIQKNTLKENKQLNSYTILVVEDESINFHYISELLTNKNLTLIHALNGKEAVAICKENNSINFVLMDLKMPEMDGYEATKLIKQDRPKLPIVAQSACTTAEDKQKCIAFGFDDFIPKPFSKNDIYNTLLRHNIYIKP
ncbi:MAG: response regulator [Bacteroidales bacterium]|nr:response regulator [Bacteroidales bacterium]